MVDFTYKFLMRFIMIMKLSQTLVGFPPRVPVCCRPQRTIEILFIILILGMNYVISVVPIHLLDPCSCKRSNYHDPDASLFSILR